MASKFQIGQGMPLQAMLNMCLGADPGVEEGGNTKISVCKIFGYAPKLIDHAF